MSGWIYMMNENECPDRCSFVDTEGRQCIYKKKVQGQCVAHFFNVHETSFAPGLEKSHKSRKPPSPPAYLKKHRRRASHLHRLPKGQTTIEQFFKY